MLVPKRTIFTKIRISAHNLSVEKGRHLKLPRVKRLCTLCSCNAVEDETHFILECEKYSNERKIFLDKVYSVHQDFVNLLSNTSDFVNLTDEQKICFLLSNTSTCQITSAFLSDIYNLRVDSC
jgi:hypothetical protein